MTIVMRWGFTIVPWWQILGGLLISILTAVTIIWVAGRLFRLGMLRYGQRLSLKQIAAGLRSSQAAQEKDLANHA